MFSKPLTAASTKPIILSILARQESYGYEIIQKVKELSGGKLDWAEGMLYPVLHRLASDGFVDTKWKMSDEGRHRKYYYITSQGKAELQNDIKEWSVMVEILNKALEKKLEFNL